MAYIIICEDCKPTHLVSEDAVINYGLNECNIVVLHHRTVAPLHHCLQAQDGRSTGPGGGCSQTWHFHNFCSHCYESLHSLSTKQS